MTQSLFKMEEQGRPGPKPLFDTILSWTVIKPKTMGVSCAGCGCWVVSTCASSLDACVAPQGRDGSPIDLFIGSGVRFSHLILC
jgi:hypothetical protein